LENNLEKNFKKKKKKGTGEPAGRRLASGPLAEAGPARACTPSPTPLPRATTAPNRRGEPAGRCRHVAAMRCLRRALVSHQELLATLASPSSFICATHLLSLSPSLVAAAGHTAVRHRRRALEARRRPSQPPKLATESTVRFLFAFSTRCACSIDGVSIVVTLAAHRSMPELR